MMNLMRQIIEDWTAHGCDWTKPGFRAVAWHRFGVWRMSIRPRLLRAPFSFFYYRGYRHCRNVYGIELPYTVTLGRRVIVEHQGGIVIHGASVIGDDCIIRQNCTLGLRRLDALDDAPIMDSGVRLGAGAIILGRITIGKNAVIGANAVVIKDIPEDAVAVGVPAQVKVGRCALDDPG